MNNSEAVCKHYNSLQSNLETRNESSILYLRNLNNWVKSNLIQNITAKARETFKNLEVLDLGSGKGGDSIKWDKANISHLTFFDIAAESVGQSKQRYDERKFTYKADFHVGDFTKDNLQNVLNRKYHIISCQFAFHYAFESYTQAISTIRNISNSLQPGGFFVGTTVNCFEVVKRLEKERSGVIGNKFYKISFQEPEFTKLPLFGAKYNFYLEGSVDCPEFLVYQPALDKIAEENGLRIVKHVPFPEFFQLYKDTSEGKMLMSRIRPLRCIDVNDVLDPKEYSIKEEMFDRVKRWLTISNSEWEIFSLYEVFIFQKI